MSSYLKTLPLATQAWCACVAVLLAWHQFQARKPREATLTLGPYRAAAVAGLGLGLLGSLSTAIMAGRASSPGAEDAKRTRLVQASADEGSKSNAIVPDEQNSLARKVLDRISPDAQFVLLGEASHGTHDFYQMRADITQLLVKERGFSAVVVEADFPDAFRANLYARGLSKDATADQALGEFKRFPTWMWRNTVMLDFLDRLRKHNAAIPPDGRRQHGVGFYGMDVYSLHSSAAKVIEYLEKVDPDAAATARSRYRCFDKFGADTMAVSDKEVLRGHTGLQLTRASQLFSFEEVHPSPLQYAYAVGVGRAPSCAEAAVAVLTDVMRRVGRHADEVDGVLGEELAFQARCNASVVKGAELYYRSMFFGDELTWNLRDRHFLSTVQAVEEHLAQRGVEHPKLVLWAHNSHLGDARATDMGQRRGELNIGQLMRETYGPDKVVSIGFTTHTGTVAAADEWDSPVQLKAVRPSMAGSYEAVLHSAGLPRFALDLRGGPEELREALAGPMLERAIGVIYRPSTERQSHYFYCELPRQFDMVIHLDRTQALRPLELTGAWETEREAREDAPETYPYGL
ncbi:hypothetical protein N2152v2_007250 [Parachlorella kessleri]